MSEGEKHTPAPWFVANLTLPEFADPKVKVLCIADSDGEIICQLYTNLEGGTFDHYERDEANARVIAAAPKLLLALQRMVQQHPDSSECPQAREVIDEAIHGVKS